MDNGAAHNLQQPHINRALEHRAQLRWIYYFSLGLLWFLRPHAFSRVFVTNNALTINGPWGTHEILLHQVTALSFFHIPFLGGWITLRTHDGRKFRFTSFLERTDYIVDAIAIAQPTLVPAARLANFRRSVIVVDHLLARMEGAFSDWRTLILMQMALPMTLTMAVAAALNVKGSADAYLIFASIGLLNGIVTLAVWWSFEFWEMLVKGAELLENPLNALRDVKREKSAKIYARVLHVALVASAAWWMWL